MGKFQENMPVDGDTFKKFMKISPDNKALRKISRKIAFSRFLDVVNSGTRWECCGISFKVVQDCQRHVSDYHSKEVNEYAENMLTIFRRRLEQNSTVEKDKQSGNYSFFGT